ncbi:putative SP-containing membrane protein [Vairimorpha necatrix]|uniref:SP-containing membrane protein n=1 Tax=Vairimorpha necatrix TaxID=6039 RepID=A0AAX4J8Q3_9MICR
MRLILYFLYLFSALATVNQTNNNMTDSLKNIFKSNDSEQHCNVLRNFARRTLFPLDSILKLAELIWDVVINHPIFKRIIQKDNLTTIFETKADILKYDYVNTFSGHFYQNYFWNSESLTDQEVRFIDKIAWETRSILRSLRFCNGDEIFNSESTNSTIQRIVNENICYKSNGIDKFPYIFYKRCKHLYSHFERCLLTKNNKVDFLGDIKRNQVGVMSSECSGDQYDFKKINMSVHHDHYSLLNMSNTKISYDFTNTTDNSIENGTNIYSYVAKRTVLRSIGESLSSSTNTSPFIVIDMFLFLVVIFLVYIIYKKYYKKKINLLRNSTNVPSTNEESV